MKICYIITQLELGGAQLIALKSIEYLASKGHDLILITNQSGILNDSAVKMKNVKKYFLKDLIRKISITKDRKAKKKIYDILLSEKPHIVHTHSSKAGVLGRLAAKHAKVPCIVHTVHGYGFHFFKNKLFKNMAIALEKRVAKFTDKLIFVSKDDMKLAKELKIGKEENYNVIRAGISFQDIKDYKANRTQIKKKLNIPSHRKIIVNISPFKRQKNLMLLLEIIYELSKTHGDKFFTIIVGDGKDRAKMENFINRHELNEHILLTGFLPDVRDILSISAVYVSTSLWEGLPRTVLEAMLMGVPVIAPSIGGIKEVIKDNENGFLYTPWEKAEALELIKKVVDDTKLLNRLKKSSSCSISEEFSLNTMFEKLEELYNDR